MKSTKTLRTLSTILSFLSIIAIIYVDTQIAVRYVQADGKTKALFGLVELGQFGFKFWILVPAILSILLTVKIIRLKEFKIWDALTILISLTTIIGTITSSWRLLI